MTQHEHRYQGQTLRHSHEDIGPHGYYEHPEDFPPTPDEPEPVCTDLPCEGCGAPAGRSCEAWCIADQALPAE